MAKTPLFQGSCTAIVTPYTEQGIDYERLRKNLDFQYENGTAAIVVCGTTGEAATQNADEHNELVRFTVQAVAGRMKVIAGVGSNNTQAALRFAENAKAAGADGILMVTPYYNKTSQKGLIEHFTAVADRVEIPMILYNVPSRTGIGIAAETYQALSQHPNINGIKEASGDFALIYKTRSLCGDDLTLWSGNDDNTVPMMAMGAKGVISVASNIVPAVVAKLCALCLEGSYPEAMALFARYNALFGALFLETNPIPVKAAMKLLGTDSGFLRLPLTEISDEHLQKLKKIMQAAGLKV
ncbi:MAG: 4-hydroxy-tetrahydrodipicolinate synthase [Oscillospiraceae bacterium]|nr:4-hydroxy-tetrahydrodipicolinate synthase [Oscillospiraceae bacterium]